jgi:DNA mismatch endonuclease (patch repair protein)
MSHVRSKGNKSTEGKLIEALSNASITGWRTQAQDLPSCPDFVFDAQKIIVFVDGCFWHGCPHCKRLRPKSSKKYWNEKIEGNIRRDKKVRNGLRKHGWSVLKVWEHQLKKPDKVIARLVKHLNSRVNLLKVVESSKQKTG